MFFSLLLRSGKREKNSDLSLHIFLSAHFGGIDVGSTQSVGTGVSCLLCQPVSLLGEKPIAERSEGI